MDGLIKNLKFHRTIKFRLSALFCFITIVMSILAVLSFYSYKKKSQFNQLEMDADRQVKNLAENAMTPLLNKDEMQLSVLVFTAMKNPGVLSAAILDHKGKVLMHPDISQIGTQVQLGTKVAEPTEPSKGECLQKVMPITMDNKPIGTTWLIMDTSRVLKNLQKLKIELTIAVFTFIGLGSILIIHMIGKLLAPLDELAEAAAKVGQGDLSVKVQENGGDEIKKLAKMFNRMSRELSAEKQRVQEGYLQSVMALAAAVEAKDPYTRGHCDRTAYYAHQVAQNMGMDEDNINQLGLAAQLHDLGKIGVDKSVLCKPGRLTDEEYAHISRHPLIAWKILEPARFLSKVREIILVHHERYDGKGYPNGLSGDQICQTGKILAIADCYDAMTTNRPYRKHLDEEKALSIIKEEKGRQFAPEVVDAFLAAYPHFEDRKVLDRLLETSSRGRIWVYDDTFEEKTETENAEILAAK